MLTLRIVARRRMMQRALLRATTTTTISRPQQTRRRRRLRSVQAKIAHTHTHTHKLLLCALLPRESSRSLIARMHSTVVSLQVCRFGRYRGKLTTSGEDVYCYCRILCLSHTHCHMIRTSNAAARFVSRRRRATHSGRHSTLCVRVAPSCTSSLSRISVTSSPALACSRDGSARAPPR